MRINMVCVNHSLSNAVNTLTAESNKIQMFRQVLQNTPNLSYDLLIIIDYVVHGNSNYVSDIFHYFVLYT